MCQSRQNNICLTLRYLIAFLADVIALTIDFLEYYVQCYFIVTNMNQKRIGQLL